MQYIVYIIYIYTVQYSNTNYMEFIKSQCIQILIPNGQFFNSATYSFISKSCNLFSIEKTSTISKKKTA